MIRAIVPPLREVFIFVYEELLIFQEQTPLIAKQSDDLLEHA